MMMMMLRLQMILLMAMTTMMTAMMMNSSEKPGVPDSLNDMMSGIAARIHSIVLVDRSTGCCARLLP